MKNSINLKQYKERLLKIIKNKLFNKNKKLMKKLKELNF